jgi:hypothetical protein
VRLELGTRLDRYRPRRRREDNIKMDLQEVGYGIWTGSTWLRIGTGGGRW